MSLLPCAACTLTNITLFFQGRQRTWGFCENHIQRVAAQSLSVCQCPPQPRYVAEAIGALDAGKVLHQDFGDWVHFLHGCQSVEKFCAKCFTCLSASTVVKWGGCNFALQCTFWGLGTWFSAGFRL